MPDCVWYDDDMNKQNQHGSASVIIIIVLVIAIIAALGFTLWQKLQPTTATSPQASMVSESPQPAKYKIGQIDDSFPAKLSWSYPESWTVTSEGNGPMNLSDTTTQKFIITPPSKKYEVIYYVGWNGGLGGSCEPGEDKLQLVQRTALTGYDAAQFMEVVHGSAVEGYTYISGLFDNAATVQAAKVGDSFCDIYLRNIINLNNDGKQVILAAQINIKQFVSADEDGNAVSQKESKTIQQAFDDPEYKEATKILLSTVSR